MLFAFILTAMFAKHIFTNLSVKFFSFDNVNILSSPFFDSPGILMQSFQNPVLG